MRKFFIFLSLIMLGVTTISIQAGNDVKLSKEEKAIVKKLKSSFKPKSVDMKIGDDGFKYFELIYKDGIHSITDSLGNIIIDKKYGFTNIIYNPQSDSCKTVIYNDKWGGAYRRILSVPADRSFIASQNSYLSYLNGDPRYPSFFYNENGELINIFTDQLEKMGDTLYRVHHVGDDTDSYGVYGLISSDGKTIIPLEYKFITPKENLGDWAIRGVNNELNCWGIYSTKERKILIPCIFNEVKATDDGLYKVRLLETDTLEIYNVLKKYEIKFHDLGEKYFHQKRYRDVIAFYEGNDSINLGKMLTNISYHRLAADCLDDYNRYLGFVSGSDYSVDFCDELRSSITQFKRIIYNWDISKSSKGNRISLDSFPQYQQLYDNARIFLYRYLSQIIHMEDEVNIAIPSFKDRRRDFQITEERKRQEQIRQEQYERERQKREREWEQLKKMEELKIRSKIKSESSTTTSENSRKSNNRSHSRR